MAAIIQFTRRNIDLGFGLGESADPTLSKSLDLLVDAQLTLLLSMLMSTREQTCGHLSDQLGSVLRPMWVFAYRLKSGTQ